jgi:DNA-binding SARP family transcriptional activator
VHVLGPLYAQTADGVVVQNREWRTGKTADLLRLLALSLGRPLSPEHLTALLWPTVERCRAQASLRTAASQIRHVLGHDCLVRSGGGLVLDKVWVDVAAFREAAAEVAELVRLSLHGRADTLARHAELLYRGPLDVDDELGDWAAGERQALADLHGALLVDAAETALALGQPRRAQELGRRVTLADPFGERATRLLIRSYVALGETSLALGAYQRCRRLLADELGVDPSSQTQALYLEVLREWVPDSAAATGLLPAQANRAGKMDLTLTATEAPAPAGAR